MKKLLQAVCLVAMLVLVTAYFYPSNNDFDPTYFATVAGKITLLNGGTGVGTNFWTFGQGLGGLSPQNLGAPYNNFYLLKTGNYGLQMYMQSKNGTNVWFVGVRPSAGPSIMEADSNNVATFQANLDTGDLSIIKQVAYSWPTAYGSAGAALVDSSGAGALTWSNINQIVTTVENFYTVNQHFGGKVTVNELIVSNGFAPGFANLYPSSNGTNFIIDASKATYFTILATNAINLQYLTNTTQSQGVGGAAVNIRVFPNGADRLLTVNTNWVPFQTNIWTLITTVSPGLWQTTVTNASDGNGPRWFGLSAVCYDGTFVQTNVLYNALLSP